MVSPPVPLIGPPVNVYLLAELLICTAAGLTPLEETVMVLSPAMFAKFAESPSL